MKTLLLSTRYLRSLCDEYGCQSDCIINDNAEVIHKMVRQPGTFIIFQNFIKEPGLFFFQSYCNFGTLRSSYFSDHHSEISRHNSFAFERKLQKLTDFIDIYLSTAAFIFEKNKFGSMLAQGF